MEGEAWVLGRPPIRKRSSCKSYKKDVFIWYCSVLLTDGVRRMIVYDGARLCSCWRPSGWLGFACPTGSEPIEPFNALIGQYPNKVLLVTWSRYGVQLPVPGSEKGLCGEWASV